MNHKTYIQALAKLAALEEQQKTVATKRQGMGQEQQAAQSCLKEATEADTQSKVLFAQAVLDGLRCDELVCRDELRKLDGELSGARAAVTAALQKLCCGIADQLGDTLKRDKKLRAVLVDICAACYAMTDTRLGGVYGGMVAWDAVLADIFPEPAGIEFDAAYDRLKSELAK
jgi:multidrug resistance efflux pump